MYFKFILIFRFQEKSYIDDKFDRVEKTVAMIASQNDEKDRRNELREEFQKLSYTVQSVKDVLVKNDDKIGEIVMKIENLVNWVYEKCTLYLKL